MATADGVMKMRTPDQGWRSAAGETVELKPGGISSDVHGAARGSQAGPDRQGQPAVREGGAHRGRVRDSVDGGTITGSLPPLARFPVDVDRSRLRSVLLAPGWAAPRLACADMSPSPLRGGARGGGNQRGHISPFHSGLSTVRRLRSWCAAALCHSLAHSPHPRPLPIKGRGDVAACFSPRHPRRVLCKGSRPRFSAGRSWHDPHSVESALAHGPRGQGRVASCRFRGASCRQCFVKAVCRATRRPAVRLSPPTSRGAYNSASFAATGRGWRHPTFTCRRPAPGRRARWLEIQEARCDRFRQSVSNGAEPETAERHMAARPWGSDLGSTPMGGRSLQRGSKNAADAGAARQPIGAGNRPLIGCRAAPAFPSHPRRHCRRGQWRLQLVKEEVPVHIGKRSGGLLKRRVHLGDSRSPADAAAPSRPPINAALRVC